MKTRKLSLFAIAAIAVMATSCSNDEQMDNNTPQGFVSQVIANTPTPGANTRVAHEYKDGDMNITWATGDAFTVYASADNYTNYTLAKAEDAGKANASFSGTWSTKPAEDTPLYAIYPSTIDAPTAINLSLTDQSGTIEGLKDFNYMTASATFKDKGSVSFSFAHQVAIVRLELTFTDDVTAAEATNVGLTATGLNKSLKMDLTNEFAKSNLVAGDVTTGVNTLSITTDDNGKKTLTAYLCIFGGDNLSKVKAIATADGQKYEAGLSDLVVSAGTMYRVSQTLKKAHPTDAFDNEAPYGDGDGSEEKPYEIATKEQLIRFSTLSNGSDKANWLSKYYKVTEDIDLENVEFKPIASKWDQTFSGNFNGNNHTISGMKIGTAEACGLFSQNSGRIYALHVVGEVSSDYYYAGGTYCGGIAGQNDGDIIGCSFTGTVYAYAMDGFACVGGIAGTSSGSIISSYSYATSVSGSGLGSSKGAIATGSGTVSNCYFQTGASVPADATNNGTPEGSGSFAPADGMSQEQVDKMNAALTDNSVTSFEWTYVAGGLPTLNMK